MALTQPLLYSTAAFDATKAHDFEFFVVGGSQVVANTLTIKTNPTTGTPQQVYQGRQVTYKFTHTLPAGTLTNGTYYQATLTTEDAAGNVSAASLPIQFWAYKDPTFKFSNIPSGNIITASNFQFEVEYAQDQNEPLNIYVFNLYSLSGSLIASSGAQYTTADTVPLTVSYLFTGLEDNTSYRIEAIGYTSEGTAITTGQVQIAVSYDTPSVYSPLVLTNNCDGGYITIESQVIGIEGQSDPDPPTYINNKEVDVRQDGTYVRWVEGFEITNDYTLGLWGRAMTLGETVLVMLNNYEDSVEIVYMEDETTAWVELYVKMAASDVHYEIKSGTIAKPADTQRIRIYLRHISNLYDLELTVS